MKQLDLETEKILIAFCIHEKLNFPKVKQIFMQQTYLDQLEALKDMKKTIKLKYNNSKAYAQFIKSASKQHKNDLAGSSRKDLN